uniref:Uncharacterized protein n=1 Tax=Arundo donax TaxID=35708 RepID=A0A0A9APV6_ARUDO
MGASLCLGIVWYEQTG